METEIEKLRKLLDDLQGKTVVVEGKKDAEALEALGVRDTVPINGRPLIKLIPLLEGKEVVILSDFDREGRRIAAELRELLQNYKIMLNTRLRKEFMSFRINQIEGMKNLASRLEAVKIKKEGDFHGKISANVH